MSGFEMFVFLLGVLAVILGGIAYGDYRTKDVKTRRMIQRQVRVVLMLTATGCLVMSIFWVLLR